MKQIEFLNGLTLLSLVRVRRYEAAQENYPMYNAGRPHNGLLFTLCGTETYRFRDSEISAVPGSVLYIPKGEEYGITLSGRASCVITVDFELVGDMTRPFLVRFSPQSAVRGAFLDLESEWNGRTSPYLPECKSLFYKTIALMSRSLTLVFSPKKEERIREAVEYLNAHFLENGFRLERLASIAGMSYRYFEQLFSERYASSPKEYVISLKLERAKELLIGESIPIKDIALLLGYSDVYHFGKLFCAKTGYTPSEYKKRFSIK